MNSLQKALLANAIFSGVSGIICILFQSSLAQLFHLGTNKPFWITGTILLFFTMTIILEFYKKRYWSIVWIIIQDAVWVVASIILLLLTPFDISLTGNYVIGVIALIVAFMGVFQAKALMRMPKS